MSTTVYGKNSVLSILKGKTRKVHKIILFNEQKLKNIPSNFHKLVIFDKSFFKIANSLNHQGYAASVDPLKTHEIKNINDNNIFVIDKIFDKRNLGSIIRTLIAFNCQSLIINKRDFVENDISMLKSASGSIEYIKIYPVSNINNAINVLKKKSYFIFGLDADSKDVIYNQDIYCKKNAFVIGSEGDGISHLTKKNCDKLISIPINDKAESLNISNAVSAFLGYFNSINSLNR